MAGRMGRAKLHVTNIPKNLTEADLTKLFEKYGTVQEVYINTVPKANRYTNWGFVSFSSFKDADKAIDDPPTNFEVKYSSETLEFIQNNGKLDSSVAPNKRNSTDESRPTTVFKSPNTMIIQSPPTNGLQKLSLGRSMSSFGGEELCKVCGKDSVEFCMCCQTHYCSLQCANVIRRHKLVCVGDVDDIENRSVSASSITSGPIKPQRKSDVPTHSVKQENFPSRRSLDFPVNHEQIDNKNYSRNRHEKNDRKKSFNSAETNSDDDSVPKFTKKTPPRPYPKNTRNNKISPKNQEKHVNEHSDTDIKPMATRCPLPYKKSPKIQETHEDEHSDMDIKRPLATKCPLPLEKFTKVTVSWNDENSTHVFITDRLPELIEINSELNKAKLSPVPPSDLKENYKCAAKYEGDWFRAKIVRVARKALVEFVDFGNSEEISLGDIMKLPDKFSKIPRIAFPIKFEDGTRVKTEDVILVKPVGMDRLICYVVSEKNKEAPRRERSDSESDCEIEPPLSLKTFLKVNIMKIEKNDTYWVTTRDGFNATLDMSDEIESSLPTKVSRPELNRLYAAELGGQWYRAKVTNLSPLVVFLIDSGTNEEVTEVFKLPKQLYETAPKALKVKIDRANSNFHVMDSISIRAIGKKKDLTIVETQKKIANNNHYQRK